MKKLLMAVSVLAAIFACASAMAGIDNPILLLGGRIKSETVPVAKSYTEMGNLDYYVTREGLGGFTSDNEIRIDPRRWSSKPVAEGKIPSANDGLLNPGKPVVVVSYGDTVDFHFDYYQYNGMDGILKMRVMDSSGRTLGTVTEQTNPEDKPLKLKLSGKTQRYYAEIYDPAQEGRNKPLRDRYCYLLVEVERSALTGSGTTQPSQQSSGLMGGKSQEELIMLSEEIDKYMAQHNIKDSSSMSVGDFQAIINNTNKSLGYEAFDIKDFWSEGGKQQGSQQSAPAKKAKSKRTKKFK